MTYDELVTSIKTYSENTFPDFTLTNGTTVTSEEQVNRFIQQAEQRIYNTVQLSNLRRNMTSNLIANTKYIAPPQNFLSVYSLAIYPAAGGDYTYLLNKDVNFIREAYPDSAGTGTPRYYAIFGTQSGDPNTLTLILGPTPDAAYGVELHYFYYPESIVTAGTTWLGEHFDSALLYGALCEAITYMKGEADMVKLYQDRYVQALALLKNLSDGKQRGDAYRDGQLRVQPT